MARAEGRLCFGVTEAGKVILRGIGFLAFAALLIPAFDVLSVLVCVCLVALVVGFVFRPQILVTGTLPDRIIAGEVAHLTYTIRNIGRLPAYHLRVRFRALPAALEQTAEAAVSERLGPGQATDVTVAIRPQRRGCYRLRPPVCESSFPFNLFHFGRSPDEEESLIVLPAFSLLDISLPYVSRHVQASSLRPAGRMGTSPEYIGNRPFQPGDPPHRIDVRAWARLSVPATKEYDNDLDNYAALVLDTRVSGLSVRLRSSQVWSRSWRAGRLLSHLIRGRNAYKEGAGTPQPIRELEAAVSLCASMGYTIHKDCLIDLLLAGTDLHSFASLPRATRLGRVQEILAAVEPATDYTAEQVGSLWEDRLEEISEVIFIVLRWDHTYRQLAHMAEQAGCHCTVLVVAAPDAPDFGLKEASDLNPQSEIRNPQLAIEAFGDVRFVAADEVLAGRRNAV
ncbi:MAG: DUF58 domain-containing protein [Planctomycetes bacterium]|nr:DUF58 domain-containing protein [Planctomycetota bacterium]